MLKRGWTPTPPSSRWLHGVSTTWRTKSRSLRRPSGALDRDGRLRSRGIADHRSDRENNFALDRLREAKLDGALGVGRERVRHGADGLAADGGDDCASAAFLAGRADKRRPDDAGGIEAQRGLSDRECGRPGRGVLR